MSTGHFLRATPPHIRRARPAAVESLESRRLLSVATPTAQEQYLVQLINRARLDPSAEATLYQTDLNEGLPAGTISAAPKQPLAINPALLSAARAHSQWMLDTGSFAHNETGGIDPGAQMSRGGYPFTGGYGWGQNIAWSSHAAGSADTATVATLHQDLFVDANVGGRGHRVNLLDGDFKEVGVGVLAATFSGWPAVMASEDFAYTDSGSQSFLTGAAYTDAVVADHFYTPGEGLGGVSITATRLSDNATYSTTTWDSGGYTLALPQGTYRVTAAGGGLAQPVTFNAVTLSGQNVERDFVPGGGDGSGGSGGTGGTPQDTTPPRAVLAGGYQLSQGRGSYLTFSVTYTDDTAINAGTLDGHDVLVSGPGGLLSLASLVKRQPTTNGPTVTATYQVRVSRGKFTAALAGSYRVFLEAGQVADTAGNPAAAGRLGVFKVRAPVASSHATPKATPAVTPLALPAARDLFSVRPIQRDDGVLA